MKERINRPKVFLSYSFQDAAFIERIENDLRRCQIESWRDRTDIRDGRPWLDSIFEEGLPTCDVVIVYFTENSLSSGMVAKEVDAAQVRQLKDSGISFLPYVNRSEMRTKLRLDIQALHCRVWNDENYNEVFPTVVAEIWRSYMERHLGIALMLEKNRRLELEIELHKLKTRADSSSFTSQETEEFRYIYSRLDVLREAATEFYRRATSGSENIKFSFVRLLMSYVAAGYSYFGKSDLENHIKNKLNEIFPQGNYMQVRFSQDLTVDLITYGLVEHKEDVVDGVNWGSIYPFTPRLYRFRFWLEVNNISAGTPFESPSEVDNIVREN